MNLSEISIKRPIFIICVVSLMLVFGMVSMSRMGVDMFPDVTFPTIFVQTTYKGASPVDMEKLISKPIEDELGSLPGLDKMYSQNAEGISTVILMFKIGTDIKDSEQQVQNRIGNIRSTLPDDIDNPIVRRFDPADQPIVMLGVKSNMKADDLYDLVNETVKNQFETIAGVGQVQIIGGRKKEIQVLVDRQKAQDREISLTQISNRIKQTASDTPVGSLKDAVSDTSVRASGEFENVSDINDVNVNFLGSDHAVRLNSVAEVKEGLEDEASSFTLREKDDGFKVTPAIVLQVYKQSGANTVSVSDLVQKKITKVNELMKSLGKDASISLVRETSKPIRLNVKDVAESIIIGILLCVFVVFFFLGSVKSTFITGLALPNSLLGGFVLMYAMGFTINVMTLLALSLAVGLLIDDAIVVRENIFRHLEMGKNPRQAALDGTKEVALAVLATTMVVISVFGPIAFLQGIVGQFFRQFGLTVVFTMLISLFDAFTMAPMLSTYLATSSDQHRGDGFLSRVLNQFDRAQTWLENIYEATVRWVLQHRLKVLLMAGAIFIGSLFMTAYIPKNFLPAADAGEFMVNVELGQGTSLTATKAFMEKVSDEIIKSKNVRLLAIVSGYSDRVESNKGTIFVELVPSNERKVTTSGVKDEVRVFLEPLQSQAKLSLGDIDVGGGNQKPLQLILSGQDLDQLSAYVNKLKPRLEKIPGFVDVDTNFRTGKPEFQVVFDRAKSENLGVSTVIAGTELRARVEGLVPAKYRRNGIEYDIRVRLRPEDRDLKKEFSQTVVPNVNNDMIYISKVATPKDTSSYSQINRYNKGRYIQIDGNLGPKGNLGTITDEIVKVINTDPEFKPPTGISYQFIGQAEDFKELIGNMLFAIGLGVLLIYLVLSSLYESFITPMTILLALPLAMTGAFGGLLITGKSIDIFSMIGIIMLLGVVAKNSILVVDYAKKKMDEGMDRTDALIQACKTRLRPILMTSFALIGGTIPIAIGLNEASAQRTSMGVAIIGGVLSSTFLTLLVVPAAFGYIDDFGRWLTRKLTFIHHEGSAVVLQKNQGDVSIEESPLGGFEAEAIK